MIVEARYAIAKLTQLNDVRTSEVNISFAWNGFLFSVTCDGIHRCQNGGTCSEASCICPEGWEGKYCQTGECRT